MSVFKEIKPENLDENIFDLIGRQWMLVTAGNLKELNTMTASWGGAGVLWSKPVAFSFIRPQRYTYEFIEKSDYYTLSFYDEKYRDALRYCGSHSGRNVDKVKETGLTPIECGETVAFDEAKLIFVCRKLYHQDLELDGFNDKDIANDYNKDDLHRIYVGEIVKVLDKE